MESALCSGLPVFPHKQDCYFAKGHSWSPFSNFFLSLTSSFPPLIWVRRGGKLDWGVKLLRWLFLHWRVLCVWFWLVARIPPSLRVLWLLLLLWYNRNEVVLIFPGKKSIGKWFYAHWFKNTTMKWKNSSTIAEENISKWKEIHSLIK